MATYGFELETASIKLIPLKGEERLYKDEAVYKIFDKKTKQQLYVVTGDTFRTIGHNLEIGSCYPAIGENAPSKNLFEPITEFYQALINKASYEQNQFIRLPVIIKSDRYDFTYCLGGRSLNCYIEVQEIQKIKIRLQFTFGLNIYLDEDPYIYERFYLNFDPFTYSPPSTRNVLSELFVDAKQANIIDGKGRLTPFSPLSKTYLSGFELIDKTTYSMIEFYKFLVACSLRNITDPENGNKDYMPIMPRTSLRIMWNPSIFKDETNEQIVTYIKKCLITTRTPFNVLAYSPIICSEYYVKPKYNPPQFIDRYRMSMTVSSMLKSIFYDNYQHEYDEILKIYKDIPLDYTAAFEENLTKQKQSINELNLSINNIQTYDFMCPAPYSLNTDAMGYYTRIKNSNYPMFEIRYADSYLKIKYLKEFYGALQYTPALEKRCIEQFELAYNNWK